MPGMNGIEFLQRVKDDYPDTVRIVLSGFADAHLIVESINKGEVYRFVPKPWNDDELKATLRQCLDQYDILFQNRDLARRTEEQNRELQSLNSRLESMVEDRTYALRLAQEILEHLPVGVVGISCDAEIVLVNAPAREALPSLASAVPGTPIESALPGETADAITECLAGCEGECPLRLAGNGHPYEALLKPLEVRGSARGHVLVMYPRTS